MRVRMESEYNLSCYRWIMADVNVAHCRWTSCVVRLTKLYHKLLQTQNNFRRSIVTRRHDCTVMFMIKCCRTEVNQSNVWRLHSPEIHLLNMHNKTTSTVDKMPSSLRRVSFLSCTRHCYTCWQLGMCDRRPLHAHVTLKTWKQILFPKWKHSCWKVWRES